MADYYPRLTRALAAHPQPTFSVREAVYTTARKALLNALESIRPPVPVTVIRRQETDFAEAVARVEADVRRRLLAAEPTAPAMSFEQHFVVSGDRGDVAAPSDPEIVESVSEIDDHTVCEERPMSRLDELNKILRKLQSDSPGLEASALISEDGLMIASALTPDLEETRVAGMTATLLNLGTRAAVELARGEVKEVIIRGDRGYAVMINAGRGALLLALANESAKLGLIFFDMHEAIRSLKKVL